MKRRRFLITCATGDIGKALCFYLAENGHELILTARDSKKLADLTDVILKKHPQTIVHCCAADLAIPETMENLIKLAGQKGLDGFVLMPPRPPLLTRNPKEDFLILTKAMTDSFIGPRYLLEKLLPSLEESGKKSVVFVSGASSKEPINDPSWEAFNDIRTLWLGCIKTFSNTYGSQGIRFNTVSPGQIETPTYIEKIKVEAKNNSKSFDEILSKKNESAPLKILASVNGVVKTIYFLLKSSGANEITGANIIVNGGRTHGYCS